MPELMIKYKGTRALHALEDFAKYFDFVVVKPKSKRKADIPGKKISLPITFADNPDISALAGIWKGKNISLEELRKNAWGNRI